MALGLRGTSRSAAQMQFLTRLVSWVVARGHPGSWCSGREARLLQSSCWLPAGQGCAARSAGRTSRSLGQGPDRR